VTPATRADVHRRQADGTRSTQTAKAARKPKVDCFYVYPTVSDQQRENATLAKDPEI
jgi:hypothetical protein